MEKNLIIRVIYDYDRDLIDVSNSICIAYNKTNRFMSSNTNHPCAYITFMSHLQSHLICNNLAGNAVYNNIRRTEQVRVAHLFAFKSNSLLFLFVYILNLRF